MLKQCLLTLVLWLPFTTQAALKVFACEPEWAALVQELGGERTSVYSATTGLQDPHRIEARPSLIARARQADLLVCTGAELEIGWLPQVLAQAGNARIQQGRPGHFEAAAHVNMIEVPARVDRAEGDIHRAGNPHIHLDPRNIQRVADALAARLSELDAAHAAHYQARHRDFTARWREAITRWEAQGSRLRGMPVAVHHRTFSYLIGWLGLREVAVLEPKPGVEPSAAHLAKLLETLQRDPARLVMRATYQDARGADWFAARARIPAVALPATVGGSERATDLFSLFDALLAPLLAATQ